MVLSPQTTDDDRQSRSKQQSDHGSFASALTADDFSRLGVRPHESRQSVIRQAAIKSSKTLARRQLVSPSPGTELQLSMIATSTYRLLDPRNRVNTSQRTSVGRIFPNAMRWAGRTQFSNGQDSAVRESSSQVGSQREQTSPGPAALNDSNTVVLATGSQLNLPWLSSLDESDLLRRRRFNIPWFRMQLHQPAVSFLLICLLTAATIWVWDLNPQSGETLARVEATTLAPNSRLEVREPPQATSTSPPEPDVAASPLAAAKPTEVSNPTVNNEGSSLAELEGFGAAPSEQSGERPSTSPAFDAPPIKVVEVDEAMQPRLAIDADIELEMLLEDIRSMSELDLPAPVGQQDDEPADAVRRRRVPPDDRVVAEARRQLVAAVPELLLQPSRKNAGDTLSALSEFQQTAAANSAMDWAIRVAMAQCEWLVGDIASAGRRLQPLSDEYDIDINQLLVRSFIEMPRRFDSARDRMALIENGFSLADRLLIHELRADCRSVLAAVQSSTDTFDDDTLMKSLDEFQEAAIAADKLGERALRIMQQPPADVSSAQAGITGRYFCLVLRQWETGLPWLAQGTDPRLAALATDELAIKSDAGLDVRLEIAGRWLGAADRNDGREADSMRLHAIEVLRPSDLSPRGLRQLEAERLIDETVKKLPTYLQNQIMVEIRNPADDKQPEPVIGPARAEAVEQLELGQLNGRIFADQKDLGVRLEYQPSVAIGSDAFAEIATKLGADASSWTIRLAGQFAVVAATKIRVRLAETTPEVSQEIWVDDQQIPLDANAPTILVSVEPGQHVIRWVVTAAKIKQLFLAVQDVETGQPIFVQPIQNSPEDDNRAEPTIKIVQGTQ